MGNDGKDIPPGQLAADATQADHFPPYPLLNLGQLVRPSYPSGVDLQRVMANQLPRYAQSITSQSMYEHATNHFGAASGPQYDASSRLYAFGPREATSTPATSTASRLETQEELSYAPYGREPKPTDTAYCKHCGIVQLASCPHSCYGQNKDGSEGGPGSVSFLGTTLAGVAGFRSSFSNVKDAKKFLDQSRTTVNVEEDDVDGVEKSQQSWAERIFNAITTLPGDVDESNRTIFSRIQRKNIDQTYIEACAYDIVGRTIQIHRHGSELLPKVQLTRNTIGQMKASERLEAIADILYNYKNVAKDVLDGWKTRVIVDEPSDRLQRLRSTKKNNAMKRAQLDKIKAESAQLRARNAATSFSTTAAAAGRTIADQREDLDVENYQEGMESPEEYECPEDVESQAEGEDQEDSEGQEDRESQREDKLQQENEGQDATFDTLVQGVYQQYPWVGQIFPSVYGSGDPFDTCSGGIAEAGASNNVTNIFGPGGMAAPAASRPGRKRKRTASLVEDADDFAEVAQNGRVPKRRRN